MTKIGFIGFGRFAKQRLSILSEIKDIQIVGYFDSDSNLKDDLGLERFDSLDDLLGEIEGVIISVPPVYAVSLCKKALSANVHVFCEKPPSTILADLEELSFYQQNLVLAYGFNHRLHDSIILIKEIVDSEELGKILWMRGRYGKEVDESYKDTWRSDKKINGGGILIDQGIHLLDVMDWLADGFDINQSILSDSFLNKRGVEDNAFVNLYSSKKKISASLHSTITQWRYLFSLEVFLEEGSLILNGLRTSSGSYGEERLSILNKNSEILDREIEYTSNNSWKREMEAFIESILKSKPYPYSGLTEAKNIMSLLESIYSNAIWAHKE